MTNREQIMGIIEDFSTEKFLEFLNEIPSDEYGIETAPPCSECEKHFNGLCPIDERGCIFIMDDERLSKKYLEDDVNIDFDAYYEDWKNFQEGKKNEVK